MVINLAGNEVLSTVAGPSLANFVTDGMGGCQFQLQDISRRESIVIERDESDSSEDDVRDARVYFVRKNKDRSMPQVVAPPEIRPKTPDPLDGIYRQMFGSTNFL